MLPSFFTPTLWVLSKRSGTASMTTVPFFSLKWSLVVSRHILFAIPTNSHQPSWNRSNLALWNQPLVPFLDVCFLLPIFFTKVLLVIVHGRGWPMAFDNSIQTHLKTPAKRPHSNSRSDPNTLEDFRHTLENRFPTEKSIFSGSLILILWYPCQLARYQDLIIVCSRLWWGWVWRKEIQLFAATRRGSLPFTDSLLSTLLSTWEDTKNQSPLRNVCGPLEIWTKMRCLALAILDSQAFLTLSFSTPDAL